MQQTKASAVDIAAIQKALKTEGVDAWLFYYFHENDPLAMRILGLSDSHFVSRRWFYLVPASGEPIRLVHRIEMDALDVLPGKKLVYLGWKQLQETLHEILKGFRNVAMQYSPNNAIPYISRVDAGTIESVQAAGVKVVTSANLVQQFESNLSAAQRESHIKAVTILRQIVFEAFGEIRKAINESKPVNEYQIQQFIWKCFEENGMISNSPPIVAVNEHSGLPHYQPSADNYSEIRKGDFVLLDIWAKLKEPSDAVYGDITWTGYVGETVPEKYSEIFGIVSGARDAAVSFIKNSVSEGTVIEGRQVDDITRDFITARGYGEYFVHRTGHSIGLEVHANGANIDNLETQDERRILPNSCFSIEPGVYLPEFGVRSEIDVFVGVGEVIIGGGPIQSEVIPILSTK